MEKFNGKYNFEQAYGIVKFINRNGLMRIGYLDDKPSILVGFESIESLPSDYTRVNVLEMMDKEFEIYSFDKLKDSSKELERTLEEIRESQSMSFFNSVRIKREEVISNIERVNTNLYRSICNDGDKYAIYTVPKKYEFIDQAGFDSVKLDGRVLSKVRIGV